MGAPLPDAMRVLTAAQQQQADRYTIEEIGIPSIVLMENAGHRVADAMRSMFGDLSQRRITVLCGRGNNGGDGFVVARLLALDGAHVRVFALCESDSLTVDAALNAAVLRNLSIDVTYAPSERAWTVVRDSALSCDVLVDALLGTGLSRPLRGFLQHVVETINGTDTPVVAIDLPTGLSDDGPPPWGDAIEATLTVTLTAPKPSLLSPPTATFAGEQVVADIGIPDAVIDDLDGQRLDLITPEDAEWLMPVRPRDGHKGDFGHVLVVAGSLGKTGAAVLAARGALRAGAGLVTVATPARCLPLVAGLTAEYMTVPLPDTVDGGVRADALDTILEYPCDVIAVGPGLGTGESVAEVVWGLVERSPKPLVLDADALNVIAHGKRRFATAGIETESRPPIVLTPHPGEMARLTDRAVEDVQANRIDIARQFATDHAVTVLLKGSQTVIASPDGAVAIIPTGNPGMATGGSGDVLTGVVAAWMGQLPEVAAACRLGAYLHGLAGDLAAEAHGETALTATDLVDWLGRATCALRDHDGSETAAEPRALTHWTRDS